MGAIKEIYYGNLTPSDLIVKRGTEYTKKAKAASDLIDELAKRVPDADGATKKLDDLHADIQTITAESYYEIGFRDGARLMMDILLGQNENFEELK